MSNFPGDIALPDFVLDLGSQALSVLARDCLVSLRVHQRLSMPSQCELTFEVVGPRGSSGLVEQLTPGLSMTITMRGQAEALFSGSLSALQYSYGAGDRLRILARGYDGLHRMRQHQEVAAYPNLNLASLARLLVKKTGAAQSVRILPGSSVSWPLLVQHQQTDLEFLNEMAAQVGRYLYLRGDRLDIISLAGLPDEAVPLTLGDNLIEADLEVNTAQATDAVEVTGWSAELAAVQRQVVKVSKVGFGRQGAGGGDGSAGGDRSAGGDAMRMSRRYLVNESTLSGQQAQALAQAELDRRRMSENTLWGKAAGDARLCPGAPVEVRNVAAPAAGRYVITEAVHSLDFNGGYITEISSLPPEVPSRPRSDIATVGRVTDIMDPGRLGRVRVELPAYSHLITDWLPVTFPGGGPEKGFVSLPAIKDHVLVLLLRENPAEGVVLGGLYAAQKPPDSDLLQGAVRRYTWKTAAGQKIQLNENGDLVRLETSAGAAIELNGSKIVIQGSRIDFRSL